MNCECGHSETVHSLANSKCYGTQFATCDCTGFVLETREGRE